MKARILLIAAAFALAATSAQAQTVWSIEPDETSDGIPFIEIKPEESDSMDVFLLYRCYARQPPSEQLVLKFFERPRVVNSEIACNPRYSSTCIPADYRIVPAKTVFNGRERTINFTQYPDGEMLFFPTRWKERILSRMKDTVALSLGLDLFMHGERTFTINTRGFWGAHGEARKHCGF